MARRRRRAATRTTTRIIRASSPAPIVRVQTSLPARRRTHRRSRRRSGHIGGSLVTNEAVQMAIGGALYGYAVKLKLVDQLPALPLLGKTGTAAIILDYFGRHGGGEMCRRAARAAAAIAGYTLGTTGAIEGDANTYVEGDDMEGYADQ